MSLSINTGTQRGFVKEWAKKYRRQSPDDTGIYRPIQSQRHGRDLVVYLNKNKAQFTLVMRMSRANFQKGYVDCPCCGAKESVYMFNNTVAGKGSPDYYDQLYIQCKEGSKDDPSCPLANPVEWK